MGRSEASETFLDPNMLLMRSLELEPFRTCEFILGVYPPPWPKLRGLFGEVLPEDERRLECGKSFWTACRGEVLLNERWVLL